MHVGLSSLHKMLRCRVSPSPVSLSFLVFGGEKILSDLIFLKKYCNFVTLYLEGCNYCEAVDNLHYLTYVKLL